jgi:hypothetical protein
VVGEVEVGAEWIEVWGSIEVFCFWMEFVGAFGWNCFFLFGISDRCFLGRRELFVMR